MSTSNRRSRVLLQAVAAMNVIAGLAIVARAGVPVTLIADTSTPIPNGTGDFTSFSPPVADRDNPPATVFGIKQFFFQAQGANVSGIYQGYTDISTPLEIGSILDTTATPPTGGNYSGFSSLSAGFAEIGFIANTTTGDQLLIAGDPNNPLVLIAQTGDSPSSGQTFGSFQNISVMDGIGNGGNANDMEGEINTNIGIYDYNYPSGNVSSGPLSFTLVANTNTTPPGASGPFTSYGSVSYKAGRRSNSPGFQTTIRAVVATVGGAQGIYYGQSGPFLNTSAPLVKLADTTTTVPSGTGTFTSFGNPIATNIEIDFTAHYNAPSGDQQGIFSYGEYADFGDTPQLTELVTTGDVAPDSNGAHFANFLTLANNEVFTATLDNGVEGLYEHARANYDPNYVPPTTYKILDTSETLDGKSIADIEISPEASELTGTAFKVDFADGSEGIYYFVLPEPTSLALLILPGLLLLRRAKIQKGRKFKRVGSLF